MSMDNKRPKIGIIGGAGAMAGALLFETIVEVAQKKYKATHDADFPFILLLNFPFSNMLSQENPKDLIKDELKSCFDIFKKNDISVVAIACNTLHDYLPDDLSSFSFVHMIDETARFLQKNQWNTPLVLCTSTSKTSKIHKRHFDCSYTEQSLQKQIDTIIDEITAGDFPENTSKLLTDLFFHQEIVLGCTELSFLHKRSPIKTKRICDPNLLVAEKICELTYGSHLK